MLKVVDNPPIRPEFIDSIADLTGVWWVARTKSRFEKAFAWDLVDREIGYFLPMIPKITLSHRRKRRVLTPLFPGYVFFVGDLSQRQRALSTNRLRQVLPVTNQRRLISELVNLER